MILQDVYLKEHFLVLRDRDGTTVELTLEDTSDLLKWLEENRSELERRLEQHRRSQGKGQEDEESFL